MRHSETLSGSLPRSASCAVPEVNVLRSGFHGDGRWHLGVSEGLRMLQGLLPSLASARSRDRSGFDSVSLPEAGSPPPPWTARVLETGAVAAWMAAGIRSPCATRCPGSGKNQGGGEGELRARLA